MKLTFMLSQGFAIKCLLALRLMTEMYLSPSQIYDQLSDFGQKLCREVVAAPGEVIDTGPRPNPYLLYKNHKECYKKMGLTDADLEEYREKGIYLESIRTVRNVKFDQEASFYQRKKKPVKDEL